MRKFSGLKNKLLVMTLVGGMLLPSCTVVSAQALPEEQVQKNVMNSEVDTYGALYYEKTVTKYYTSVTQIPDSIFYSEHNSALQSDFKGTLYLVSVERLGDRYKAVFEGTLAGSGL